MSEGISGKILTEVKWILDSVWVERDGRCVAETTGLRKHIFMVNIEGEKWMATNLWIESRWTAVYRTDDFVIIWIGLFKK